jgi:hypothetical protein
LGAQVGGDKLAGDWKINLVPEADRVGTAILMSYVSRCGKKKFKKKEKEVKKGNINKYSINIYFLFYKNSTVINYNHSTLIDLAYREPENGLFGTKKNN